MIRYYNVYKLLVALCCFWFGVSNAEVIETNSISDSTVKSVTDSTTTVKSPPEIGRAHV